MVSFSSWSFSLLGFGLWSFFFWWVTLFCGSNLVSLFGFWGGSWVGKILFFQCLLAFSFLFFTIFFSFLAVKKRKVIFFSRKKVMILVFEMIVKLCLGSCGNFLLECWVWLKWFWWSVDCGCCIKVEKKMKKTNIRTMGFRMWDFWYVYLINFGLPIFRSEEYLLLF